MFNFCERDFRRGTTGVEVRLCGLPQSLTRRSIGRSTARSTGCGWQLWAVPRAALPKAISVAPLSRSHLQLFVAYHYPPKPRPVFPLSPVADSWPTQPLRI